ncbi:hypothetical protein L484_004514 [Morus notabilis]|uniref:Senescence regulator n=1 Tax=Morus notabilis TaxID=981085 RepID=W9QJJ5_9ROSA|nr:phospholipase D C [Morus notabilis]EXB38719.1 hypothetical protein L484_004514 [Morus notabilis]
MENRYGLIRQSSGVWRSLRDGDFEEEDVWSVLKDRTTDHSSDTTTKVVRLKESSSSSPPPSLSGPKNVPTASRIIPKAGGGSRSVNLNHEAKVLQQSAPINTPNWPNNIYRHKSKKASKNRSWLNDYDDDHHDDDDEDDDEHDDDDDDDDDDDYYYYNDDDYAHKVPPHELIARRLAKSQISSFSVFEGVGRTLKGRDLSKVRNAILTKTGFLESL